MTAKQDTNRNHNYLDLLTDDYYYEPRLVTNTKHDKYYVCKVNNDLSVRQYFLLVVPHTPELINEHKNESNEWIIQLIMQICFINPNEIPTRVKMFNCDKKIKPIGKSYIFEVSSNVEKIKFDTDTNKVTCKLVKTLLVNYEDRKETSDDDEYDLMFNYIR